MCQLLILYSNALLGLNHIVEYDFDFTGFSQCFTDSDCTGGTVPAATERECCVETDDGLAFLDGGECTECIGEFSITAFWKYPLPNLYSSWL